jgi:hypothetical protein
MINVGHLLCSHALFLSGEKIENLGDAAIKG